MAEETLNQITPTLSPTDYQTYKIKINLLTKDVFDFSKFVIYFKQELGISDLQHAYTEELKVYNIPSEKYSDIIQSNYSFNNKEFIVLIKNDIDVKNVYQNELYKITLEKDNSTNIQYLMNKYFCQQNSDCQIIQYECSYGAFNQYQQIKLPFGCEAGIYDYQENYYFGPDDKILNCDSEVTYQQAKCINYQCVGENRTIECI